MTFPRSDYRIRDLLVRVTLSEDLARAGNMRLPATEMITSIEARDIFDLRPDLDFLFIFFSAGAARANLNVCFQRCALNCRPICASALSKEDLTAV